MAKYTDKNLYTVLFTAVMVLVVGTLLAFLASSLKEKIGENKRIEKERAEQLKEKREKEHKKNVAERAKRKAEKLAREKALRAERIEEIHRRLDLLIKVKKAIGTKGRHDQNNTQLRLQLNSIETQLNALKRNQSQPSQTFNQSQINFKLDNMNRQLNDIERRQQYGF